ncbi:hypothetical protein D3C77_303700 [compost metagenome]
MGINIYGKGNFQLLRQLDQPACHFIVIRAGGVLGANRYIRFLAVQVIAHGTHVDRDHLLDAAWNPGGAVPDLLIVGYEEYEVMLRLPSFALAGFQQPEQGRNTRLVIEMAGLDVTAWGNDRAGVEGYEITRHYAQLHDVFFIFYKLIDADFHIFLFPFEISGIAIYMYRRAGC